MPPRQLLPSLLRKAFALPSDAAARALVAAMPLVEVHAPLPLLAACQAFLEALAWEAPAVCAALAQLLPTEPPDALALLVGLMAHASTSCMSRRRAVVCSILLRVPLPGAGAEGAGAGSGSGARALAGALAGSAPGAAAAALRLHARGAALLQDLKDRAFNSVFVQPCLMLASAPGVALSYVAMDAEVHGAPSLAALLRATTGIRVSHAPELRDEATGFVDAVAAGGMEQQLQCLWDPAVAGRSWGSLRGAAGARPARAPVADVFCGWRGSRLDRVGVPTVQSFALQGVARGAENAPNRRFYAAAYLQPFARYFEEGVVVPLLVGALLAAPGEDLSVFLQGAGSLLGGLEEGTGPGEWLYDLEAFPPVLRAERAWALLEALALVQRREAVPGVEEVDKEWACPQCTLLNAPHIAQCEACEAERP